jgi:hypothetical protein
VADRAREAIGASLDSPRFGSINVERQFLGGMQAVPSDWMRLAIVLAVSPLLGGQAAGPAPPFISSLSPSAGAANANVTLTGRQFTADNTVVFGNTLIAHVGIASAIGIACTTDPSCRSGIMQTLGFKVPAQAAVGPTEVSVRNANGVSNAVDFTVVK